MKRRLPLLVLLLALLCSAGVSAQTLAPIPALDTAVVDATGTLDADSRQALQQQALALQQRKGAQLQILIVPSTGPEPIEAYTQRVFDQWQLGRKGVDDAVLLVVAKNDRRVRIQPGYGLEGAIPDAVANRIIQEYLVPHFRDNDYAGGITAATGVLVGLIDGEALPAPLSSNQGAGDAQPSDASFAFAIFIGGFFSVLMRLLFSTRSRPLRVLSAALLAGVAGGLLLSLLGGGVAALAALLLSVGNASSGGFASGGGFGRGGFGGGGSGGGGWSGGGGRSGGGGASGSW